MNDLNLMYLFLFNLFLGIKVFLNFKFYLPVSKYKNHALV